MPSSSIRASALFCRSSSSGGIALIFLLVFCRGCVSFVVSFPLRPRSSARSSARTRSVTGSGPSDIIAGGTTGEAGRAGRSRSLAVDVGCSARERLSSATTSRASSLTAPISRASEWAFCCLSSQSLARANETGSSAGGLSDESRSRFLSALQRSLYRCSRPLTVTLTLPLWGIAFHNSSQMASMLRLKSGGTQVGSPPMVRRRDTLRRRRGVASGSGTVVQGEADLLEPLSVVDEKEQNNSLHRSRETASITYYIKFFMSAYVH